MKKNKIKNIATIMTVVLGTGILSTAETLNEGINLGDNTSNAIGSGSLATGRGTNAIGSNAFASGNNMTREQYEEFIKQNNTRLKEIEDKMKEVLAARGDLTNLENEHREIANKIKAIETYRTQIAEKERLLAEKEPVLTKEIEVKKGEKVSYRTRIEDLERRLNIIGQLDFSLINDNNREQAVNILAQDLKSKMENGVTINEYPNGIPINEYENVIREIIKNDMLNKTTFGNFETFNFLKDYPDEIKNKLYHRVSESTIDKDYIEKEIISKLGRSGGSMGSATYIDNEGNFYKASTSYDSPTNIIKHPMKFYFKFEERNLNYSYEVMEDKTKEKINELLNNSNNDPNIYDLTKLKQLKQIADTINNKINELKIFRNENQDEVGLLKVKQKEEEFKQFIRSEFDKDYLKKYRYEMLELFDVDVYHNGTIVQIGDVTLIDTKNGGYENPEYKKFENRHNNILLEDVVKQEHIQNIINNIKHKYVLENPEENLKALLKHNKYYEDNNIAKIYNTEIDRLKALEKDTQDQITIKENEIAGYRSDITNLTNLLNGENPGNIDDVTRQINEKKELIANKEREIETLKANISTVKDGENALANGTNSRALGKASISIGTNNYTNQESSIALGTNNTVNGEKSIAIGYGHNIQGNRNATLGDPNKIYGNDNFVIGNNITIGSEQNPVNNNLVFGSNINIQNVSNAIVLGNGSEAVENAVSVGKLGAERKIVNVADGKISETSKEAINGSQLYKFSLLLDDKLSKINLVPSTPKVDTTLINADIANALAIAGIPQVSGNKLFSLGAGTGYNAGQAAIALGISGQTPNKMFIFKLSGAVNLKKGYSVSAGVNINFGDIEDYNNKKLENEIKKLNERIEKQENKPLVIKDYSKELIDLNDKNKDLEKLNKDLSKELEVIKERLNEMNNNVEINYSLDNFDFDKSELKESHKQILDRLNFRYAKSIVLVGYADEKGTTEYNQKLSEKRAKAVYDYLREKGITQDIYYLGRGKQNLISSIQEKNRRVEISIR